MNEARRKLESTQEARVALGYASSNSYASSVAKTPGGIYPYSNVYFELV